MMQQFTVATCVSNPTVYEQCLLGSLNRVRGKHAVSILPIINTNGAYSATIAYNIALKSARSPYVVFAHQDVSLLPSFFENLEQCVNMLPDLSVIGSAGVAVRYGIDDIGRWGGHKKEKVIVGSVWDTTDISKPPYWDGMKYPVPVHSVDECLFVVKRQSDLTFDTSFHGFHGYGIDISLSARSKGQGVYASDLPIIHHGKHSTSISGDRTYWFAIRKLYKKWSSQFKSMLGTYAHWDTVNGKPVIASYIQYGIDDGFTDVDVRGIELGEVRFGRDKDRL